MKKTITITGGHINSVQDIMDDIIFEIENTFPWDEEYKGEEGATPLIKYKMTVNIEIEKLDF